MIFVIKSGSMMNAIWFVWMGAVASRRRALTQCESPHEETVTAIQTDLREVLYLDLVATTYSSPVPSGSKVVYLPLIAMEPSPVSHPSTRLCPRRHILMRALQVW
jgi:hypothetical protein